MSAEDDYKPWRPDVALTLTYRQLDYWTRLGYLETEGKATPGSGHRRAWSAGEVGIATMIGRLRLAGLELPAAAYVARYLQGRPGSINIGRGIRIEIESS